MKRDKYLHRDDYNQSPLNNKVALSQHVIDYVVTIVNNAIVHNPKIIASLAFDVGAYIGSSVPRIRALGFKNIVCFEADPGTYAYLSMLYGNDANIKMMNVAISSQVSEKVTFFSGLNEFSTLEPTWIIDRNQDTRRVRKINVCCRTLDTLINDFVPAYIKIDVEGHELQDLKGLSIKNKPALFSFEYIDTMPEKNIPCIERLSELGCTLFNLDTRKEEVLGPDDAWLTLDDAIKEFERLKSVGGYANCWCI